jgi:hypothetical protein
MAGQNKLHDSLNEFLRNYANSAIHLYVSGTLFEPHPGYFSDLSGKEITNILFPDIRDATKRMTLIPDSWKLTNINFQDKTPIIIEMIKQIAEREKQQIYLLAPNRQKAMRIKNEIEKADIKDIFIDYYRSDLNMGVERSERICIALGMAETPANSCDPLAHGETDDERWIDSRKLRKQGVEAATWQAVNRVRDPSGQSDSRVYFIGSRLESVLHVAKWGINRQVVLKDISERKGSQGETIKTPYFDIQVDNQIELPNVYSEGKHEANPSRRKISDYVKQIELYDEPSSISKNPVISSIYINRENDLIFYNLAISDIEFITTINGIKYAFLNREDCYAVQYFSSTKGKWQYRKEDKPLYDDILRQHILGQETIGVYQISSDDHITWCCIDIDSHHGESGTEDKVKTVIKVLQSYGIPFMLEASGSPNSYHIWIFLRKTRTYNGYRFIRQVRSECGINSEVWPKQKTIQSEGSSKYGNPVKVPICVNKKTGKRSVFLNPDTFEPISGAIKLPGIVELFEIAEPSKASGFGMPKAKAKTSGYSQRDYSNDELDYCMKRALEDNIQLIGSDGHHLRLAIVCKAQAIGMDDEEITLLFQNQDNYDYDISHGKVVETKKYNYLPWSCDALLDKCGKLIAHYCKECPMMHKT